MRPEFVFALVLTGTIVWIAIPFIPALLELLRPRDAAPLRAVGNDSGLLTYFAHSFTERLTAEGLFEPTVPLQLADGSPVRVHASATPLSATRQAFPDFVVTLDETPLPNGMSLATECLARANFRSGSNGSFRAILGQGDVHLGAGSTVQRWTHARGTLHASTGVRLLGRATADREIRLDDDVQFDRLDAPAVRVSRRPDLPATPSAFDVGTAENSAEAPILPVAAYAPFTPEGAISMGNGYWRVRGDLVVPTGCSVSGSIIVIGNVRVSDGARVDGAIKAHGTLHVGARAVVVGALSARERITIDTDARVSGPVISEREVIVGAATVGIGGQRTTVTAPRVLLHRGATVYGAVMSADGGRTLRD